MMTKRAWRELAEAFKIDRGTWGEVSGQTVVGVDTLEQIAEIGLAVGLEPAISLPEAGNVVLDLDAALLLPEWEGNKPASKVREITGMGRRLGKARAR